MLCLIKAWKFSCEKTSRRMLLSILSEVLGSPAFADLGIGGGPRGLSPERKLKDRNICGEMIVSKVFPGSLDL